MRQQLLRALISKYTADFDTAKATLNIYLTNPVGIGEHPQHLEEMDKMVADMVEAQDKKTLLLSQIKEEKKNSWSMDLSEEEQKYSGDY